MRCVVGARLDDHAAHDRRPAGRGVEVCDQRALGIGGRRECGRRLGRR
jgi:hypothetical protein